MRFENDDIRIIIEKKQLNEEQKEIEKLRRKKRRPAVIIACLLIASIIGGIVFSHGLTSKETQEAKAETEGDETGNADKNEANSEVMVADAGEDDQEEYGQVDGEYVSTTKLASGIKEKYGESDIYNYTYGNPIENVGREEAITFQLGYDVEDLGISEWTEVFALYEDPDLTKRMGVKFSFDEENNTFIMEPSETSVPCRISILGLDVETVEKYPHDSHYLYENGAGSSWGNLGTAYLASYRDKQTGELLDKPEVSIVTFQAEIEETPKLNYSIMDDGRPKFYWNEVEGATEYMVCRVEEREDYGYQSLSVLGVTQETSWTTESPKYDSNPTANKTFKTFLISEDDWEDESSYDYNLERYGEAGIPHYESGEYASQYGVCVIAVNEEGTSMISNVFMNEELAPNLPYKKAYYTETKNGFVSQILGYEEIETLPVYDYITMCDGYTVKKVIDYQTEKAYMQDNRYMLVDEETGELIGGETLSCLVIPYRVQGTPFLHEFTIKDYDEANMEEDMAFLEDREEKLTKKSGDIAPSFSLQFATQDDLKPEKIRKVDSDVVATSALSEYLAVNLLGGVTKIDLSDFPEAADRELVDDAFLEAYYQNPLILGITRYRISNKGTYIKVVYDESLERLMKTRTL